MNTPSHIYAPSLEIFCTLVCQLDYKRQECQNIEKGNPFARNKDIGLIDYMNIAFIYKQLINKDFVRLCDGYAIKERNNGF